MFFVFPFLLSKPQPRAFPAAILGMKKQIHSIEEARRCQADFVPAGGDAAGAGAQNNCAGPSCSTASAGRARSPEPRIEWFEL
jgi:hypothetical protein